MQEGNPLPNEGEEKTIDSTSALQKVLRLDKKHTNFDYHDSFRNVSLRINYPQVAAEGPASETLLKSLWRHVTNYYFKKIEEGQLERLNYVKTILASQNQGKHRFETEDYFWTSLAQIFSPDYLQHYLQSAKSKLDYHNWLELLYLHWKSLTSPDPKEQKKLFLQSQNLKKKIAALYDSSKPESLKLEEEKRVLGEYIGNQIHYHDDEIAEEIKQLQNQLTQLRQQIGGVFHNVRAKVEHELTIQDILFCDDEEAVRDISDSSAHLQNQQMVKIGRKLQKLEGLQAQTKYIEYIIRELQKKQIAQSVSKIQRFERIKGESKVLLVFQEAMGIKPQQVSVKQFLQINSLREYSLLKFYNTASKSRYSFICQNYLGFKDMHDNRTKPCKLKNKDILEEMRRSPPESQNAQFYREFNKMEICHHCKLLHPESALVSCDYRSTKCGNPIPPSPYYDSYVYQILKNEQSRTSAIRFLNSSSARRNSYFHYIKKDEEYVCERKYCRYCLKNYEENKDKAGGGLCPYCRAICYCTRCSRNDMMTRLKSMYILMGGDINKLQAESHFQKYYQNGQETMGLRRKDKSSKASRRSSSTPNRMNDKMVNIRYQLEDLRIICDLVKRREKNKQKLFGCQKDTFRKKMEIICPDFDFARLQKHDSSPSMEEEREEEAKISDKLTKKLKRMIN